MSASGPRRNVKDSARSLFCKALGLSLLLSGMIRPDSSSAGAECRTRLHSDQAQQPQNILNPNGAISSTNVITALANVRDYGAKGDGMTDDTAAIDSAQKSLPEVGGILYFPPGTYAVSGSGIVIKKKMIVFKGAGMWSSTLKRISNAGPIIQSSGAYPGIQGISFEDLGFDWDYPRPGRGGNPSLVLYGSQIQGNSRISRCRFWKSGGFGVALMGTRNVVIENSLFHSPGDAHGGAIYMGNNSRQITITGNRFLYLREGIIVATRDGHNRLAYTADSITISDNYFDLGWWLLKEKFTGEGASVTYTGHALIDSRAHFSDLISGANDIGHNVRVMPVKQGGSGTFTATGILDSQAKFVTHKVRRGDIVRAGAGFAVVAGVESETRLAVEEWLADADRQQTTPPPNGAVYKVYGIYLGAVWGQAGPAFTSTSIVSKTGWWDLDGKRVIPPPGTRYEVLVRRPNYPINADYGSRNISVQNNIFKRGWSDQISIYADKTGPTNAVITGNRIEDGQDMGITLHGTNNYVAHNTISHQGCGGIWTTADKSLIDRNTVKDSQWVNETAISCGDIILTTANSTTVSNNYCERISTLDRWGITVWSGTRFTGPTNGNILKSNRCRNHTTADIGIVALFPGSVSHTVLNNNEGKVVIDRATGTNFSSLLLKPTFARINDFKE